MTTTVFTEFLRVIVASMGVQGGNIFFFFVDSCAARLLSMSFVRNVKVVYYPPNCISMLTTSRFGHHMVPQTVVQEVPSTKSCVLHALGTVHKTENKFPSSSTFHSSGFAASHCEMFSSLELWALTQLTCTPILKVMVMMPSTRTVLG
jgi:hypothetical protein